MKLLLSKPGIRVNAANARGSTALDVLLETPGEHGDVALGEMILAAGGKTTTTMGGGRGGGGEDHAAPPVFKPGSRAPPAAGRRGSRRSRPRRPSWKKDPQGWSSYTPTTLMVVAVLIATLTFQAGLQPPNEFTPGADASANSTAGGADHSFHHSNAVPLFMLLDMTALFASISVILLMICAVPPARRWLMSVLVWVVWVAVFCTALAFTFGALATYPGFSVVNTYLLLWLGVLVVTVVLQTIRCALYLARKVQPREKDGDWGMRPEGFDEEGQIMEGHVLPGVL